MKHIAHFVGMIAIAAGLFTLQVFVEENYFLFEWIVPPADVTLEEWLESFRLWGTSGIALSFLGGAMWYGLGQWRFSLSDWRASGKRIIWYLLFVFPLAGVVLGILLTRQAQEGAVSAYVFYFINAFGGYYLETVLFSPSSFKYTPVGAKKIRRWRLAF